MIRRGALVSIIVRVVVISLLLFRPGGARFIGVAMGDSLVLPAV
jgi:hypothetical protein